MSLKASHNTTLYMSKLSNTHSLKMSKKLINEMGTDNIAYCICFPQSCNTLSTYSDFGIIHYSVISYG